MVLSGSVKIWLRNIILALVILTFATFLVPSSDSANRQLAAEINGERVTLDVYRFHRSLFEEQERQFAQRGIDAKMSREFFDRQAQEFMVLRYVMAQKARELGFEATDEEVRDAICSAAMFQSEGSCRRAAIAEFAANLGFDDIIGYTEMVRRSLLVQKLRRLAEQSVRVSDAAARAKLERDRTTVKLRYAAARTSEFRNRVNVTDAAVQSLLETQPERVRAVYDERIAEYQKPEEIRARQILFTGEGAKERAAKVTERLSAGEDFAALATELSEDEATKASGGDLGWIPRGRMRPEFDEAAFAGAASSIVGPIETPDGVFLVRIEERRDAVNKSLEDVRQELARELIGTDLARQETTKAAQAMAAALEAGKDFEAAAQEAGMSVGETVAFSAGTTVIPGIGRIPGLVEAAFALRSEAPHSPQIFPSGDSDYLISLLERSEPDPATLEGEVATAKERLTEAVRNRLFEDWYQRELTELQESGRIQTFFERT
jgi:peptidyl-prolyl cis-trans isomerase D